MCMLNLNACAVSAKCIDDIFPYCQNKSTFYFSLTAIDAININQVTGDLTPYISHVKSPLIKFDSTFAAELHFLQKRTLLYTPNCNQWLSFLGRGLIWIY